tara:strand:- start:901 stop:1860 length:960 start_codon:yes stop_codon:yes gene_type:complete
MKRALVIGINEYVHASNLNGCANDAKNIEALISRNSDGSKNFDTKILTAENGQNISCKELKKVIEELFAQPADMAFLYFSGHGTATNLGGYLCASDAEKYNEGVPMQDILNHIIASQVKEIVVVLDCCQSGTFGQIPTLGNNAVSIREGVSILTASRDSESAIEVNGSGIFTSLVCDALSGSASDLLGVVTPSGIYSHVEQSFGAWEQRPLFKSFVSRSTPLRQAGQKVDISNLLSLKTLFTNPDHVFSLDPSYEHTDRKAKVENVEMFKVLKKLQTVGLIKVNREPDPDLYWACIESKSCQLTALGKFHWHLVNANKI